MKNKSIFFKAYLLATFIILGQWNIAAQNAEFPVLDSLLLFDSLPEYQVKKFAYTLADQAIKVQDILSRQASHATLEREIASDQLDTADADTLTTKEERKSLSKALKAAKSLEKKAAKKLQKAEKATSFAMEVSEMDSSELRKNLPKAYKSVAALIPEPEVEPEPIADIIGVAAVSDPLDPTGAEIREDSIQVASGADEPKASKRKRGKKKVDNRPPIKRYNPAEDVMLHPPARPCVLTVDTRDEFSGELRREVIAEELFRFTNPSLKAYYPDREQIVCQASLSTNNGTYLLNITFTINDSKAQRAFGSLPKNGIAILKFLNGETFTLYNLRVDEGKADNEKQRFTYQGQYILNAGMFKKMQKTYLDKIRIAWSTGYEDYDVHNVDFLVRQLSCLLAN